MVITITEEKRYSGGRFINHYSGNSYYPDGGVALRVYNSSLTSPGPPYTQLNRWDMNKRRFKPMRVSGKGLRNQWQNIAIGDEVTAMPSYVGVNWNDLENRAIASANPNKPIVDLPLFLFELRELPRLIKDVSRYFDNGGALVAFRDPGGAAITYQFGIAPLLSDLYSLSFLVRSIQERVKQLKEAGKSKRIEGALGTFSYDHGSLNRSFNYSNSYVYYKYNFQQVDRAWYVARYELEPTLLPDLDDGGLSKFQWALGLKGVSYQTLWNMIPWSWLIDYFSTVGSFLAARRGGIPFKCTDMTIMCEQKVTSQIIPRFSQGFLGSPSISDGSFERVFFRRRVKPLPSPKIVFTDSFLTGGQRGILSALALSRVMGGKTPSAARYGI